MGKLEERTPPAPSASSGQYPTGKQPPHAIEAEEAVLGALMLERDALTKVIDVVREEIFYKPAHQIIYRAIYALFEDSEAVDVITVVEKLRQLGELENAGNAYYISELTSKVASAANIEYHARIVLQKYIQRSLIGVCGELITQAYDETSDVFELLDEAERDLYALSGDNLRQEAVSIEISTDKVLRQLEELRNKGSGITGIATGFNQLDDMTSGWQKSDLIILAARPSMGKTAFALSVARNAAIDAEKPVLLFSLEMAREQIVKRMIGSEAMLDSGKLRTGNLQQYEWDQLDKKLTQLRQAPIWIDDTAGLTINDLRSKARRLHAEHGIELILIDYLQLMSAGGMGKNTNREQEVAKISRSLKMLAKELDVPIIALSQLSRQVENRGGDKRPMLSDLRESGSIEQDADMVLFLYRPEYYGNEVFEDGSSTQGICEVIISKQRNGPVGEVRLEFIKEYGRFKDFQSAMGMGSFETGPTYGASLDPAGGGETGSLTMPSKMNTPADDEPFDFDDEPTDENGIPF